jgi:hypothetical protein
VEAESLGVARRRGRVVEMDRRPTRGSAEADERSGRERRNGRVIPAMMESETVRQGDEGAGASLRGSDTRRMER